MNLLRTIAGGLILRLASFYQVTAGLDSSNTPQPFRTDSNGNLLTAPGAGGGGAGTVTATFVSVPASTAGTIPAGAKGWSITFLTGTGTWGGVAVPAGFSDSSESTPAAALAYTTNAASTAFVRYGT